MSQLKAASTKPPTRAAKPTPTSHPLLANRSLIHPSAVTRLAAKQRRIGETKRNRLWRSLVSFCSESTLLTLSARTVREERGDPVHTRCCLTNSRAPSQGYISRLGRGQPDAVPSVSSSSALSVRYWHRPDFHSRCSGLTRENVYRKTGTGKKN